MSNVYKQIGLKIKGLRTGYHGKGISQEALALALKTTPNTISRWETATYKPSLADLERVAKFFGVSLAVFFPQIAAPSRADALLSATGDLDDEDLKEVTEYALYRKAKKELEKAKREH